MLWSLQFMGRTDSKPGFTKQTVIKCDHCLPWRAWVGFCTRESGQARWVLAGAKNRVAIEEVTGKLKPKGLERTSFQTQDNIIACKAHSLPQRDRGSPWGWAALQRRFLPVLLLSVKRGWCVPLVCLLPNSHSNFEWCLTVVTLQSYQISP